ncbi:MAG: RpiB/LacA/LacB family sugar-phosphate isomerase [Actinobacteria bacterium]|nr:RpiB/LacA/LacB family sugar-phosphate isomerase [Actinomycetota bacterium]
MRLIIGADHNGFEMKDRIVAHLRENGVDVKDLGTGAPERVPVEEYAVGVGAGVASGDFDTGILVCGTGQGMQMFANRVRGVRAALCNDIFTARLARQNNDANVLCVGSDITGGDHIIAMVDEWLTTEYLGMEDDTLARLAELER